MRLFTIGALLAIGLTPGIGQASLIPCDDVVDRWKRTTDATPLEEWARIYEDAFMESDCDGTTYADIGQEIIDRFLPDVWRSFREHDYVADLQGLQEQLETFSEYGVHWRIPFIQGEIARSVRDATGALEAYQYALLVLDDEELTRVPPAEQEIALLRDRLDEVAVVVAQLAPGELKLPVTRSGKVISQYSFSTRGYGRRKALVPVLFEFGKDAMTEAGWTSFRDVLETLEGQGSPDIVIVGHTDPIGSAESNLELSRARAAAIRRELMARDYSGDVGTKGMGEEQPFKFDDPGLYSETVRNQTHRRVEFLLTRP